MPAPTRLLLLPGMDGTGRLFAPLLAHLPATIDPQVLTYPCDEPLGYDELLPLVRAQLPGDEFVILGESFSGPLALRLAAERPPGLRALILAATFVESPLRWAPAGALPFVAPLAFSGPAMRIAGRMLGVHRCAPEVAPLFRAANAMVRRKVLARRARAILELRAPASGLADVPVLVLAARQDRVVGAASVAAIIELLPHAEVEWLDAPHLLLQAAPGEAAARIDRFIAGVIAC